ncbi:MAG TPA: hypothetical protein VF196_02500, partial [Casimicrobiaceae bacterium]
MKKAALLALTMVAAVVPAAPAAAAAPDRYSLANGCYALQSGGTTVAGPFRMQATELGRYLLYGLKRDFLSAGSDGKVAPAADPSPSGDWRVDPAAGGFRLTLPDAGGKALTASGSTLTMGDGSTFTFAAADGCPVYPEVDVNATGGPSTGATSFGEVSGLLDAHMHMMAFEFLGGRAHCGRPWHRYGAPYALVDCPDHYPNGSGAVLENTLYGNPARTHDPVGWPTFKDWPDPHSLTHEQSYYKWVERAWRGGLRVYVNLLVENKVLCELYPLKQNSCDEMDAVRLQAKRIRELENYIDAQNGGPGKGWFRIVTDPFQARRVINEGKLAVILGIEVSEPFGCQVLNDQPQCDAAQIDRGLDEVYNLGVRDMEIINKFDNALAGVAGDAGTTGEIVNTGNKYLTGRYWPMRTCPSTPEDETQQRYDKTQYNLADE